jgi:HEAT repeats
MTWHADLTPYQYSPLQLDLGGPEVCRDAPPLCVGWLNVDHPFPMGPVPDDAAARLAELVEYSHIDTLRRPYFCDLRGCSREDGRSRRSEIRLRAPDGTKFVAPGMIHHYITAHGYRPPDAFIAAVMSNRHLTPERAYNENLCLGCGGTLVLEKRWKCYVSVASTPEAEPDGIAYRVRVWCDGCRVHTFRRLRTDAHVETTRAMTELRSPDPAVRASAAQDLGALRCRDGVQMLIELLDDPDGGTRNAAASALGSIRAEDALQPLIDHLDSMHHNVAVPIGKIGGATAIRLLTARLDGSDPLVRSAIVDALERIGGESVQRALVICLDDPEESIRRDALAALAQQCPIPFGRRLLSEEFDGAYPFLDPRVPIDRSWLVSAASKVMLPEEKVKEIIELLAARFNLKLGWIRAGR